jgi:NADH-quinone oxidoreductase subunit F
MKEILTDVCEGRGKPDAVDQLERLSRALKAASLCELGRTAANPVLTTIQYFRDEVETHIQKKKCPAFVCRQLVHYSIHAKKCTGCQACARVCPANCISGRKKKVHVIDQGLCIHCGSCFDVCRFDAVKRK